MIPGLPETECIGVSLPSEKSRGLTADTQVKREMSALGSACILGQRKTWVAISHAPDVIPPKKELLCSYVPACTGWLTGWTKAPGQIGRGSDSEWLQKGQDKYYRKMVSTNLPQAGCLPEQAAGEPRKRMSP